MLVIVSEGHGVVSQMPSLLVTFAGWQWKQKLIIHSSGPVVYRGYRIPGHQTLNPLRPLDRQKAAACGGGTQAKSNQLTCLV